ncbi:MAG: PfkB family carbohydrate kinase [Qingshengfaniella sp.]
MSALLQMTSPVIDLLYEVRALPLSGQEAVVTGFAMAPGGGFNAMIAARRAGMAAVCGGTLGTGPFARMVATALDAQGIPSAQPSLPDRDAGCCTVLIEPSGERSFVHADGAEGVMRPETLAAIDLTGIGWVLISGYSLRDPATANALGNWVTGTPALPPLVFDPSPLVAELSPEALAPIMARTAWISANAQEATVLTGLADPTAAARALARGRQGAVVRDGAAGCILATGDLCQQIPPHKVQPIDTNGAGDTHIGSFIARLDATGDALHAAHYANIAAALSTTRKGPATAPQRPEVETLMTSRPAQTHARMETHP